MRSFGRQCRGRGHVFVKLVRQTERQLLKLGQPIPALGQQAQQVLAQTTALPPAQRERLTRELTTALGAQDQIRKQSQRLTHGKKLAHCKIVNAYDPTIAPILKGKSNCPTQFGRKPGLVAEPATGFIFANRVPAGNPSDASYVVPMLDKVQTAIARTSGEPSASRRSATSASAKSPEFPIAIITLRRKRSRPVRLIGEPEKCARKAASSNSASAANLGALSSARG